jgi:hypothetical protein
MCCLFLWAFVVVYLLVCCCCDLTTHHAPQRTHLLTPVYTLIHLHTSNKPKHLYTFAEMKEPRFALDYTFKKDVDPDAERVKVRDVCSLVSC